MSISPARERISWLLRTNRLLAHDEQLRSGKTFASAFRRDGDRPLAPSHVTRWENGALIPSRAVIRRYEGLLSLSAGSLVTLADAVVRAEALARPAMAGQSDADDRRLHALLDRATAVEPMTGNRWDDLTELIQTRPGLVLHPPELWSQLSHRLLAELAVSENRAWLQRQEAMSRLLEHPSACSYAIAACIDVAEDRSNPVVVEPVSLLDVTAHPTANRYVLKQIEEPSSNRALYAGLLASLRKIRDGHFPDGDLVRLVSALTRLWKESALPETVYPLVVEASTHLARRTPHAAKLSRLHDDAGGLLASPVPEMPRHQVLLPVHDAPASPRRAADQTLTDLLGETLYSRNPDKQLLATMLISATPVRQAVANALLAGVTADLRCRRGIDPAPALRALTMLGVDVHRPLVRTILAGQGFSTRIRRAAAWATPHCLGTYPAKTWRDILTTQFTAWQREPSDLGQDILHAITYGIGTDNHRALLAEIRDDEHMPAAARSTASWLLEAPPRIQSDGAAT